MIRFGRIILILIIQAMLCSCTPGVDESVVEFVKKTKQKQSQRTEELPKFSHPESFKFTAADLRNPFEPFVVSSAGVKGAKPEGGPDLNRAREALESFPLDSLHMVGTLEREGNFFALLRDSNGRVHIVKVGNYIGQNSGQIQKINGSGLEVKEWLSDGKGGWREHRVTIPFSGGSKGV